MKERRTIEVSVMQERTIYICDTCKAEAVAPDVPGRLPEGWWVTYKEIAVDARTVAMDHTFCSDDCITAGFTRTGRPMVHA